MEKLVLHIRCYHKTDFFINDYIALDTHVSLLNGVEHFPFLPVIDLSQLEKLLHLGGFFNTCLYIDNRHVRQHFTPLCPSLQHACNALFTLDSDHLYLAHLDPLYVRTFLSLNRLKDILTISAGDCNTLVISMSDYQCFMFKKQK